MDGYQYLEGLTFRFEARVPSGHFKWYAIEDFFEEVLGSPDPWPQYNIWRKSTLFTEKKGEILLGQVPGDAGKPLDPPLLVHIRRPVHIYMMGNLFDLNVVEGQGISISPVPCTFQSGEGGRLEALYRLLDSFCRSLRPVYGVGWFFKPKDFYWSIDETKVPREHELSYTCYDLDQVPPDTLERMKKLMALAPGQFQLEVLDSGQAIMRRVENHPIIDDTGGDSR